MPGSYASLLDDDGYVVVPDAIEDGLVASLQQAVSRVTGGPGVGVADRGGVYAFRNLFHHAPGAKDVLGAPGLKDVVTAVLGAGAFCVRGCFLNKTPRANWKVPWHQDATIAVKERTETVGFGPWSMKGGVQHVMAPPGILSSMLTVRVHLDDCGEGEGAMKVIPGSHEYGRLPQDSIEQFTGSGVELCEAEKGSLVAMRPLLLHASGTAPRPGSRRVIQLDFAARKLPAPLEWHEALPLS